MNEVSLYALSLEKKLISEFRTKFYDKIGYHPLVITKSDLNIKVLGLEHLEEIVLSYMSGKKIPSLKSRTRKGEAVILRQLFCYISHKLMRYSSTRIGNYLKRDHATILAACTRADGLISTEGTVKKLFTDILEKINSLDTEIKSDESTLECV